MPPLEMPVFSDVQNDKDLLNEKQFGFRANQSTYMAITQLDAEINNTVEQNKTTFGVFRFIESIWYNTP